VQKFLLKLAITVVVALGSSAAVHAEPHERTRDTRDHDAREAREREVHAREAREREVRDAGERAAREATGRERAARVLTAEGFRRDLTVDA
jgi:hypothetical protein